MTEAQLPGRALQESDRLHPGDLKALAAPRILAGSVIVLANHVRLGARELPAVQFAGPGRQRRFFPPYNPAQVVARLLPAGGTLERCRAELLGFREKISLFHMNYSAGLPMSAENHSHLGVFSHFQRLRGRSLVGCDFQVTGTAPDRKDLARGAV